jgi:hypothetical protein
MSIEQEHVIAVRVSGELLEAIQRYRRMLEEKTPGSRVKLSTAVRILLTTHPTISPRRKK